MAQIAGIKFSEHSQVYYFDSGAFVVKAGDGVIVKTEQGMGLGTVVMLTDCVPESEEATARRPAGELKSIFRLATDDDYATLEKNKVLAREAQEFCRERIGAHKLDMKLVDVEVFFDKAKILFYFTAPGRVDFRELVKDLVRVYRTRIELRQIGVRHEAQMLGALGNCGQVTCCRRFIRNFHPVTIKMAKEQNLFLNPVKISGMCGRLLCCLSFEEAVYRDFSRQCPQQGQRVKIEGEIFSVLRCDIFTESVHLLAEHGQEERIISLKEWHSNRPENVRPLPAKRQAEKSRKAREHKESGESGKAPGPAQHKSNRHTEKTAGQNTRRRPAEHSRREEKKQDAAGSASRTAQPPHAANTPQGDIFGLPGAKKLTQSTPPASAKHSRRTGRNSSRARNSHSTAAYPTSTPSDTSSRE